MKASLCDFCLAQGKVTISHHRGGYSNHPKMDFCSAHKPEWKTTSRENVLPILMKAEAGLSKAILASTRKAGA